MLQLADGIFGSVELADGIFGSVERAEISDELFSAMNDADNELEHPPDLRKLFSVGEVL